MQTITVDMTPGFRQPTIHYSQNDVGTTFAIDLRSRFGDTLPASPTVKIQATKPSGFGFSIEADSVADSVATFTTVATMTDEAGRFQAELEVSSGGVVLYTANFYMEGEANPHPIGTTDGQQETVIPTLTLLVERVEAAAASVLDMEVNATTLAAGSQATYSYDEATNTATFGIPQGEAGAGAAGVTASAYSASRTYAVGDYVIHNNNLYRCTTAITTAEAFTAAHWTQVVLGDDVTDLKSDLNDSVTDLKADFDNINNLAEIYVDTHAGYLSANGNFGSQDSTALELYTDKIPVKKGNVIAFSEKLSEIKSMWVAYGIYDTDGSFIERVVIKPSGNAIEFEDTVTIGAGIGYILFTYRTYGIDDTHIHCYASIEDKYATKKECEVTATKIVNESTYGLKSPMLIPNKTRFALHRGLSHQAPENTIPAFTLGGQAGAWGLETDIWESTDGVFYCFHDQDVSRMTDGTGNINSMTSAQINALTIDAGYNIEQYTNLKIPTIQQYLNICKKYGCVPVIEIKAAGVTHYSNLIDIITDFGMIESVIFITASLWAINQIRNTGNQCLCAWVRDAGADLASVKASVLAIKNCTLDLGVPDANLTKSFVDGCHDNNLPIIVWTCDNLQTAETYLESGVDIITSNEIVRFE